MPLRQILREPDDKGSQKHGRILTSDYQFFNDPKLLLRLATDYKNIELKLFRCPPDQGFHTKGYIFNYPETDKNQNGYQIIIGSSNLTASAIKTNHEWNTSISSKVNDAISQAVLKEFEVLWNSPQSLPYTEYHDQYAKLFTATRRTRPAAATPLPEVTRNLKPNPMQRESVANLMEIVKRGEHRALLISATGTGKTFASAFALKHLAGYWQEHLQPELHKMLFLVHREQLAEQARQSYAEVFAGTRSSALLAGGHKPAEETDFIFATTQPISKYEIYSQYRTDYFDVIIIDEAHRVGAPSYQKLLAYFRPRILLGMSASPERTDNFDVYQTFDNNIADKHKKISVHAQGKPVI